MHFEGEMPFKMHEIIFFTIFFLKKSVPTLLEIFRPVTQNTLIFLFGLTTKISWDWPYDEDEMETILIWAATPENLSSGFLT